MISVAIIEDNRLVREGLAALVVGTGKCTVVAVAAVDEDMARLRAAEPRVILPRPRGRTRVSAAETRCR